MMRGFCPRDLCPEGAYVLMELCMEGILSKGVLSGGDFVLAANGRLSAPNVFTSCIDRFDVRFDNI